MSATTSKQVPVTITYHQPGTRPPVFLAGDFSQWNPQEMSYSTTDAGEHFFTETIKVPEGTEIQYKFRLGPGNWWVLDETAEKVSDGQGNLNNIARAPFASSHDDDEQADSQEPDYGCPPLSHEKTNAEADYECPMFSHENIVDYGCPEMSHEKIGQHEEAPIELPTTDQEVFGTPTRKPEDINYNDPNLEHFPSESRDSIMAALRRISSSTEGDHPTIKADASSPPQLSPTAAHFTVSTNGTRGQASGEPSEPLRSPRSLTSLQSIIETAEDVIEDVPETDAERVDTTQADDVQSPARKDTPTNGLAGPMPPRPKAPSHEGPASDDEGIAMSTGRSKDSDGALLRRPVAKSPERSQTPSSVHSFHQEAGKDGNWLQAFLRVMFIDWIGGFFRRLFVSSKRET